MCFPKFQMVFFSPFVRLFVVFALNEDFIGILSVQSFPTTISICHVSKGNVCSLFYCHFRETNRHRIETLTTTKIAANSEHQTKTNFELVRDHGTFHVYSFWPLPNEYKKNPFAITISKFR